MKRSLPSNERLAAEDVIRTLLEGGAYEDASRAVAAFEARQDRPRGIGMDWANYDASNDAPMLQTIYSTIPGILEGVEREALPALRLGAAMTLIWGTSRRRWLDRHLHTGIRFDADTCARMLLFAAQHQRERAAWNQHRGIVVGGRVSGCADSCASCQTINGRTFELSILPELPYPMCWSLKGCRCIVLAVLS